MLIREIFSEAKKETCSCDCGCGLPVCESCGKPHAKKDIKKKMKEEHTGGATGVGSIAVGDLAANTAKRDKKGLPKAKQALNKDGTAKNGLDMGGSNLLGGKVAKR